MDCQKNLKNSSKDKSEQNVFYQKPKKGQWIVRLEKLRKCHQCNVYLMTTIDFESHQERHLEIGMTANDEKLQVTNIRTYEDYQENRTNQEKNLNFLETEQDFIEIKSENVQQHQYETFDAKLENEEITSNTFGKDLNSGENSTAGKEGFQNNKDTVQNVAKAIKSENENDPFDVEGDVIKPELKILKQVEYESARRVKICFG